MRWSSCEYQEMPPPTPKSQLTHEVPPRASGTRQAAGCRSSCMFSAICRYLMSNDLSGPIPESICNMTNLEYL